MRDWLRRLSQLASPLPFAKPGPWFGSYREDWDRAHPGAWKRGELDAGHFCLGRGSREGRNVWCSSTLDWDKKWFQAQDYRLPEYHKHVEPDRNPNIIRLGSLGPGESVSIPIVVLGNSSGERNEKG